MKALILAGGKGTRLHPVTLETPKPLLTVRKKPILNYLVELFLEQGIYDIGISISAEHKEDFHWWYRRWWRDYPFRFFEEIELRYEVEDELHALLGHAGVVCGENRRQDLFFGGDVSAIFNDLKDTAIDDQIDFDVAVNFQ